MSSAFVELFGSLRLEGGTNAASLPGGKIGSIVTYLCLARPRPTRRDALIAAFWPDDDAHAARRSLRVHLSRLRATLGEYAPLLRCDGDFLTLEIASDVEQFQRLLHRARLCSLPHEKEQSLEQALLLYRGPLAPHLDAFWIVAERRRLADQYQQALAEMTGLLCEKGFPKEALPYARRAVAADPFLEEAQARLIRLYHTLGRPADARNHWVEVERLFRTELGTSPPASLRALAAPVRVVAPPTAPALLPIRTSAEPMVCRYDVPHTSDRLIARENDIATVAALLQGGTRLVTLTGQGGIGKTRLAREVAHRLSQSAVYEVVCWVPLAEVGVEEEVGRFIAERLERLMQVKPPRELDRESDERIAGHLAKKPALLVLDNLEHLNGVVVQTLLRRLLDRLPQLAVLVTSRSRLHLTGEQGYPVDPLGIPPEGATGDTLHLHPSAQLFLDRAHLADPRFGLAKGEEAAVAALCRALDGLPLALEIAAMHTRFLSPAQILNRVQTGVASLTHPNRDVPPRHRSLEATLQWSYELLSALAQKALRALSLLRGWWRWEIAEAVCTGEDVPGALAELADGSWVRTETTPAGPRFFSLETTRAFASARLTDGEQSHFRDRLTAYLSQYLHTSRHQVQGAFLEDAVCALYPNISALLEWHCARGNVEAAVSLARAAQTVWLFLGYRPEGEQWLRRVLKLAIAAGKTDAAVVPLIGLLMQVAAPHAGLRDEVHLICDRVRPHLMDTRSRGLMERALGSLELVAGSAAAARVHFQREIECGPNGATGLPVAWCNLATACLSEGDWNAAQEALAGSRRANQDAVPWIEAMVLCLSGDCNTQQGRLEEAKADLDAAFALFAPLQNPEFTLRSRLRLLRWLTASEKWDEARALLSELYPHTHGHDEAQKFAVEALMALALADQQGENALRLLGSYEQHLARLGQVLSLHTRRWLADHERRARGLCTSEDAADGARSAGRSRTLEEVLADACSPATVSGFHGSSYGR